MKITITKQQLNNEGIKIERIQRSPFQLLNWKRLKALNEKNYNFVKNNGDDFTLEENIEYSALMYLVKGIK